MFEVGGNGDGATEFEIGVFSGVLVIKGEASGLLAAIDAVQEACKGDLLEGAIVCT